MVQLIYWHTESPPSPPQQGCCSGRGNAGAALVLICQLLYAGCVYTYQENSCSKFGLNQKAIGPKIFVRQKFYFASILFPQSINFGKVFFRTIVLAYIFLAINSFFKQNLFCQKISVSRLFYLKEFSYQDFSLQKRKFLLVIFPAQFFFTRNF